MHLITEILLAQEPFLFEGCRLGSSIFDFLHPAVEAAFRLLQELPLLASSALPAVQHLESSVQSSGSAIQLQFRALEAALCTRQP